MAESHILTRQIMYRLAFFILIFALPVLAAVPSDNPVILTLGEIKPLVAHPGDSVVVAIPLSIRRGFHVNANPAATEDYIPLEIVLSDSLGIRAGKIQYPAGKKWRLEGSTEDLLVYDGAVTVHVPLVIGKDSPSGEHAIKGMIDFQACDDEVCFMPESRPFSLILRIQR